MGLNGPSRSPERSNSVVERAKKNPKISERDREFIEQLEESEGVAPKLIMMLQYWFGGKESPGLSGDEDWKDRSERALGREFSDLHDYSPDASKSALRNAKYGKARLAEVFAPGTEWNSQLKSSCSMYGVCPEIAAAIISFESGARVSIKNPNSSATGLGQFLDGTWKSFCKSHNKRFPNDKFDVKGDRLNPRAQMCAVAWYVKENCRGLGINPMDPNSALYAYIAHHDGLGGAKKIFKFINEGTPFKIPKTYRKKYPSCGQYVKFVIGRFAAGVAKLTNDLVKSNILGTSYPNS